MKDKNFFDGVIAFITTTLAIYLRFIAAKFIESLVGNLLYRFFQITKKYMRKINNVENKI